MLPQLAVSAQGQKATVVRTAIEVRLEENVQRLDEVVAVGYNTVRRAQTTGLLSQVKGEKLEFQSSTTFENRIADIHVLKDTSATAIYGSHSANGVIVITPPSGQNGHTNINYRNQFGFSFMVDYIDMMNSGQNLQHQMQCVMSAPNSNFFLVSPAPAYPDWIKIREA